MRTFFAIPILLLLTGIILGAPPPGVHLENTHCRYAISATGQNLEFTDRATGRNYLQAGSPSPCASVRCAGKEYIATAAAQSGHRVTLAFGEAKVVVQLKAESFPAYLRLTVESVAGDVDSLCFLNVPLMLAGKPSEEFGACALSLNLHTRVDALPVLQRELKACAEKKFGLIGASADIVAVPTDQMLKVLQEALTQSSELPVCKVAGPWAHQIPFNHGSYLFNFGSLTETNIQDWIEMTRRVGFTQIDNHGGGSFFRFGDLELNREKWPDGWDSFRRIVARLREAGIGSIFHTYAFFIDKKSNYVAPVPDPRLDAFRTFTLAAPLDADDTEITVNESTASLSTVTGFFEHNSVVLHLGDELVTFGEFSKEPPWRFKQVTRAAHGTKASPHELGARARHLKECFGLFVPNPESSLFTEIAARHAEIVNHCGFDGIYLDAIDGSSILRGADECWYWADKFVVEIQKHLQKPVGMEMSAMWHHFWQYRTRWQAWDHARRGHARFLDLHAAEVNGSLMLPLHLGWWSLHAFDPPQIEPSYPEVMEHLGARLIGWDAGISLTAGVNREALRQTPLFARAADILRTCEQLRQDHVFDESTRARLRDPDQAFMLCKAADGKTRFRQLRSHAQTVTRSELWTSEWVLTNSFSEQPLKFRIEALMSADLATTSNAVLLADLTRDPTNLWQLSSAAGVGFTVQSPANSAEPLSLISATNSGKVPRHGAWARLVKRFDPPLNAKGGKAMVVEVEGDGSGALLAIRLESPPHLAYGAIADRYITLDFTGRRRIVLVETESARWSDFIWNEGKHLYGVYREMVNFDVLESVSIWLQNLPSHKTTQVRLGPIRALPLQTVSITNPRLSVNGQSLELPVTLSPGSWLEGNGPEDCACYGPKGEFLGKVIPQGIWPKLRAGRSTATFSCSNTGELNPRTRITVFRLGDEL